VALTQAGEQAIEHVVATLLRGVQVCGQHSQQGCPVLLTCAECSTHVRVLNAVALTACRATRHICVWPVLCLSLSTGWHSKHCTRIRPMPCLLVLQLLQRCSDTDLEQSWREAAALAALRFEWRDAQDPLTTAQAAAAALHHHAPSDILSGPAVMTGYSAAALRWFAAQLVPADLTVFWSSRRHTAAATQREPWYGARHAPAQPLPAPWLERAAAYASLDAAASSERQAAQPAPQQQQQQSSLLQADDALWAACGELGMPEPNWALPRDLDLRHDVAASNATSGSAAAGSCDGVPAPAVVVARPGLCVWHRVDTSFGLPKVGSATTHCHV
jgi:secreted Zn-dependent insulinase-like peptidase